MPIRITSRIALADIAHRLTGLRLEVYTAIRAWDPVKRGPGPSIEDLAKLLHRKESSICGRLAELKAAEVIAEGPIKENQSGKRAITYVALEYRDPAFCRPVQLPLAF